MFPALSALRASDADREQVVAFLNAHCAQGRLSLDELSARVEAAYRAAGLAELDALTRDLPGSPFAPAAPSRGAVARRQLSAGLGVGLLAVVAVAVLAVVPAEVWAPLLMLGVPLVGMLLFAVLPLALPVLVVALVVRGLSRAADDERLGVRRRGLG